MKIVPMPEDFDQIQLTPEEQEYVIWDARCAKYFEWKEEQKKRLRMDSLKNALIPFTTEQIKSFVLDKNPNHRVDSQIEQVFTLLCQYFANDPQFEKSGYSLSKGLLLSGPVGVGKTELLKLFTKNKKQSFHLISVYEIEESCKSRGVDFFKTYTGYVPGWGGTEKHFYQNNIGWAFDDVGRESVVFDFGNKSDIISKLIQVRYLNKEKIPFNTLHMTTNLTPDEIEKRYDYAVKSRLREMFNYIQVKGSDRRK